MKNYNEEYGRIFPIHQILKNLIIRITTHRCFYFNFNKTVTFAPKIFLMPRSLAEHTKEAKHKSSISKKWVIVKHCKKSCKTCKDTTFQNFFKSTITGRNYLTNNPANQYLNCSSKILYTLLLVVSVVYNTLVKQKIN